MPEAISYRVSTYYKLAKDEHGLTSTSSLRIRADQALNWVLADLPDEAWTVSFADSGTTGKDVVTLVIDWSKVPDSIFNPKLPAQRR